MKTAKYFLFLACLAFQGIEVHGQNLLLHPATTGLHPVGSVADTAASFGFVGNPAIIMQNKRNFIGLYHQRPYMIKGLNNMIAVATCSGFSENSKLGFSLAQHDFSGYHQSDGMLSYAQALSNGIAMGIQLGSRLVHYPAIKNSWIPFGKIGIQIQPESKYRIGFCVLQFANFSALKQKLYLPTSVQAALGVEFTREFFAALDFRQSVGADPELLIFMRYHPHPSVAVQWGMNLFQGNADAAVTFQFHRFYLGVTSAYHPHLGFSLGLNIIYMIKNNR